MISKDKCTGCTACKYSCPVNAIEMKIDDLTGFNFADIDTTRCIECNKCDFICPNKNDEDKKRSISVIKRYVLRMKSHILKRSSSGGAFTMITSYFFNKLKVENIVGVKWDENFNAVYSIASTGDEWRDFRGSKYMQADVHDIFHQIKTILENNEKLLFIGTPCHVSGLLNYLGKKYDNLITIDFICNSLPSPLIWQKWLNEEGFDVKNIKSINMRHKNARGAQNPTLRIEEIDQVHDICLKSTDFYRLTIGSRLLVSDACYTCNFRDYRSHVSDFTIGDLWDAQEKDELHWDENDSNLSLVMCNNERSQKIIHDIANFHRKNIDFFDEINYGGNFNNMTKKSINAKIAFKGKIYNNLFSGAKLTDIYKKENKTYLYDVAIAGGTMCNNYGGALTYYALYKYVEHLGLSPVIIPPPQDGIGVFLKDNIFEKYCNVSENYHLTKSINFNNLSHTFMIGSDQMWNKKIFKEWGLNPYLDYVFNDKKKIAYGVSYGKYTPNPSALNFSEISRLIKKFDHISYRESDGVQKYEKFFNYIPVSHVVDPVFLIELSEYKNLINELPNKDLYQKDVCIYDLGFSDDDYEEVMKFCAKELLSNTLIGTANVIKVYNTLKYVSRPRIQPISVQEWLAYMYYSKYIITNSFHGVCFSIIFRKPFCVILEDYKDPRIMELLKRVGLLNRITLEASVYSIKKILDSTINYDEVWEKYEYDIKNSKLWLNKALNDGRLRR